MMQERYILQADKLSVGYRLKKQVAEVVSSVSINLQPGSLVTLIGANGIGKSTLLRTITGIQPPLSGSVRLDENDIRSYDMRSLAKKLSVVLTDALPQSNLTVFELVALGRQPYTNWIGTLTDEDVRKVNAALDLVQVADLAHKKHHEISDGQLQKVLIARALAQDTPLIVLDEPTTHLDFQHKASLFILLKRLTRETGKTILFSTHDLDLAYQISDEMIVISNGTSVQGQQHILAKQGVFDSIFDDESIVFDSQAGKFVYKNL